MVSEIYISAAERSAQKMGPAKVSDAVSLLRTNGYLVLHNTIATAHLEALKDIYDLAWAAFKARKPTWIAGGQIIGHLNVTPPVSKHFANKEVLGNRIVNSITSSVLGADLWIGGVGGNTNEPKSVDQYFHSDVDFKDNTKLLVNIPLGDVDEQNGSIELVPKSHTSDCHFPDSNNLRGAMSPVRINTKMGSVLIRYPHVWHRGRANASDKPRHMLTSWHVMGQSSDQTLDGLFIDPNAADIYSSFSDKLRDLGEHHSDPQFHPNYFSPTWGGWVQENLYRQAPGVYGALLRVTKKIRRH